MYLYLYAPFLKDKRYARSLALFEGRITDFGIAGKVAQLSQFLKFSAAVKEYGGKRLTTLVVVGDDELLEEAVQQFALGNVVLGYVPLKASCYAASLGIPSEVTSAAEVLAARRIVKLDLGQIDRARLFLGTLRVEGKGVEVHSPTFSLFPADYARIEVVVLGDGFLADRGTLRVQLTPFTTGLLSKTPAPPTVLPVVSCRLKSVRSLTATFGASGRASLPLQVDIAPQAIRMIVGRRTVGRK